MASRVFFADMRTKVRENMFTKIERLLDRCGLAERVAPHDLVAVKLHFGERGNHAFIRPIFVRKVVEEIKALGGKPFLTDSSTLYPGSRKEAVSALTCAVENGFAYAVVGAPLIMCDGLRGHTSVEVPITGEILDRVEIGAEIVEADALVVLTHFKCHEITGFGGALKNLGMGCSAKKGKLRQHSTVAPRVAEEFCNACETCLASCVHGAISIIEGKGRIDPSACAGCGRCIGACMRKAIKVRWNEASRLLMMKMCEFALGAVRGKEGKAVFLNFITQVSPDCDCHHHADAPIVNDIGLCASTDPVALDQACADLVNAAPGNNGTALRVGLEPGGDKFRGLYPEVEWETQLIHGENIGLGTRAYQLERI